MNQSPDQQLKEKIIEAVRKKGILNEKSLDKLEKKYFTEGFDIDDWIHLIEDEIHDEEGKNER